MIPGKRKVLSCLDMEPRYYEVHTAKLEEALFARETLEKYLPTKLPTETLGQFLESKHCAPCGL